MSLDPSGPQFACLVKQAASVGELNRSQPLAMRYAHLAAERGVRAAAAALAHAFATGGGVGEGVLEAPVLPLAVTWLRVALGEEPPAGAPPAGEGDEGDEEEEDAAVAAAAVAAAAADGTEADGGGGEGGGGSGSKPGGAPSEKGSEAAGASGSRGSLHKAGSMQIWKAYRSWSGDLAGFEAGEEEDDEDEEGGGNGFGVEEEEEEEEEGEEGGGGGAAERARAALRRSLRGGPSGAGWSQQFGTVEEAFAVLAEAEAEVRARAGVHGCACSDTAAQHRWLLRPPLPCRPASDPLSRRAAGALRPAQTPARRTLPPGAARRVGI
jgi:hypothetical protein